MPPFESQQGNPAPSPVWVSRLRLTDFRNYAALALDLDDRPVVLTGPNGAGKTNLLEAISFLSPGRGLRRARLGDVARQGGLGNWAVAATLTDPEGETDIGTGLVASDGPAQRTVRINHAPAASSQDLLDLVRVVWLTPAMDGLFTGPTSDRRRFLDRLVLAIDRHQGERVGAYEKAMRERNRLLEDGRADPAWLDAVEAQMAEHGAAIAAARRECLSLLTEATGTAAGEGSFPSTRLAVAGVLEDAFGDASASGVEAMFEAALRDGRRADRAAKRTLTGPHLSDLTVVHVPKEMAAAECSTGEQKALLTGIVLAHARLVARLTGTAPLLLLDEISAHLDPDRRADLFEILVKMGAQAWLTGTEPAPFQGLGDRAQHLIVRDGAATKGEQLSPSS